MRIVSNNGERTVQPGVVEALEDILEKAKAGEINTVAVLYEEIGEASGCNFAGNTTSPFILTQAAQLQYRILRTMHSEE